MNKDDFIFYIEDAGDWSVGIPRMDYFTATIPKNIISCLSEDDLNNFQKELADVVCKYIEPETYFIVSNNYRDEMLAKQEEEFFEMSEDDRKINKQLEEDILGKVDLDQLNNIF